MKKLIISLLIFQSAYSAEGLIIEGRGGTHNYYDQKQTHMNFVMMQQRERNLKSMLEESALQIGCSVAANLLTNVLVHEYQIWRDTNSDAKIAQNIQVSNALEEQFNSIRKQIIKMFQYVNSRIENEIEKQDLMKQTNLAILKISRKNFNKILQQLHSLNALRLIYEKDLEDKDVAFNNLLRNYKKLLNIINQ